MSISVHLYILLFPPLSPIHFPPFPVFYPLFLPPFLPSFLLLWKGKACLKKRNFPVLSELAREMRDLPGRWGAIWGWHGLESWEGVGVNRRNEFWSQEPGGAAVQVSVLLRFALTQGPPTAPDSLQTRVPFTAPFPTVPSAFPLSYQSWSLVGSAPENHPAAKTLFSLFLECLLCSIATFFLLFLFLVIVLITL